MEESTRSTTELREATVPYEAYLSGVSWPAVIAGAFVTAALSLILLALGTGISLSSVSPWSNLEMTASSVGRGAILWMILVQIIASAMGGYLAGRLRTKWATIHTDEVYFRDTAHGFLAWAVALVVAAAFLAPAAASLVGDAGRVPEQVTSPEAKLDTRTDALPNGAFDYFVDDLFRSVRPNTDIDYVPVRAQAARIFARDLGQGYLSASNKLYLTVLVMSQTGLSQPEADTRVVGVFSEMHQAADALRRTAMHACLWMFVALLIGAFSSSYAATIGGRQRDHVLPV